MKSNTNFPIKRLDIIKISLDLFLEHGYEQTKISHIMKAANLSKGGMYHYFASKEDILDGVIDYALTEELADFEALLASKTSVFEKLALFLENSAFDYSDYLKKFTQFKRHPESSIVTYRIKEITARYGIPYLETILTFGIQETVFQSDYPKELAVVLYHAGEDLFYSVAGLKLSDTPNAEALISKKIHAFNQLLTRTLVINKQDSQRFYQLLCGSLATIPTTNRQGGSQ